MELPKPKFMNACMKKWQRMAVKVIPSRGGDKCCCKWSSLWPSIKEEKIVPNDVPKGHLVVYVGEYHKRFVIKLTLLNHPLFRALLDQAQELYEFTADHSKFHIPCDENFFLTIVQYAKSPSDQQIPICL